ncbi:AI-2E family transporter [Aerococcus sanguinicola]|uniref:AI-2E family transporter n=1 Tax=Aerococcus sanguinicola TaxID=119206 RepID=A0A2I1MPW6_9LACT|nr:MULTISPECIES: AI-2E family transporter [Aerococcus]MDK7050212.1 AI-2E family transporter [Aerococcus sanguinicola]OFT92950.1 hypothetical protein HMPREF3090_07795 [Aerococcus sp. HMSC23C02]PKZ22183.1 AI-2E family transporter [Aerococcus sanguinicola]
MKIKAIERMALKLLLLTALLVLIIVNWQSTLSIFATLRGVAYPLILGCAIAYVVNILMSKYEKWLFPNTEKAWLDGLRRGLAMFLAFLTIILVVISVLMLVVPQAVNAVTTFIYAVPALIRDVERFFFDLADRFPQVLTMINRIDFDIQNITQRVGQAATSFAQSTLQSLLAMAATSASAVMNWVLGLMFSVYLLSSKEKLGKQFRHLVTNYCTPRHSNFILNVVGLAHHSFSNFIAGETVEAAILGSLVAAGMWVLQLPYAGMIGALTAVLAFIPILGAYVSAGIGALLLLTNSFSQMVIFLIFIVVIQQLEGNLIYPFVVGNSIGLPGLWVLVAVTIGGGVAGVLGMILGVPLASMFYLMVQKDMRYRDRLQGMGASQEKAKIPFLESLYQSDYLDQLED